MVVDLYRRDPKTAEPVRMGNVRFDGTDILFSIGLDRGVVRSLQRITVRGETFTPLDGIKYLQALPYHLNGSYMWATRLRSR